MMFTVRSGLAAALVALTASTASAQATPSAQPTQSDLGPQAFAAVSVGGQMGTPSLSSTQPFQLYDEAGSTTGKYKTGGGPLFDVGGGYRVWQKLSVVASFSVASADSKVDLAAEVPHPVVFGRFRSANIGVSGLDHSERVFNIGASWYIPVTVKFDVMVSAGPSIFSVRQGLVNGVSVGPETFPFDAVSLAGTTNTVEKSTGVGGHVGVDLSYRLMDRLRVGALARFTRASLDVGDGKASFGGFQLGVGVRYRWY